jgi:hypothetical protein
MNDGGEDIRREVICDKHLKQAIHNFAELWLFGVDTHDEARILWLA